ncbi:hypothetical protein Taro_004537 [Colocasia esculenta]|uniref:UDP-MurNAc-pentapeptide synthetase n=1 Tax=Colocasia esculenta TaxID=4460 RepID=A0A843TQB3_COLES|nr:hypothetical protein [Colocasia esculenta]
MLAAPAAGRPCFPTASPFTFSHRGPKPRRLSAASSSHGGVRYWSAEEIASAAGGEVVAWGPPGPISHDTRTLQPGQWFLAIAGENFDGHDFVGRDLEEAGCVGVLGNRVGAGWRKGFVRVEGDTLVALERMAGHARSGHRGGVVAVTGSAGKTTTTAMAARALQGLGRVYKTPGNWNNRIGVALTLAGLPEDADVAVVELGTRGKGRLQYLARLVRPTVRVVLKVGFSHTEFLGSLQGVAEAKGELLSEASPGDICVLNADDPLVMGIPTPPCVEKVTFGQTSGCDVRLVHAETADGGRAVRIILENTISMQNQKIHQPGNINEMVEFKIQIPGVHNAMNACAAAAIAISLGVSLKQVGDSLSRFSPVSMRCQTELTESGIRIIDDTYNANPNSMTAAINTLKSVDSAGKKVIILADMYELGALEVEAHEAILNLCCSSCFDLVAVGGPRFTAAAENLNLSWKNHFICELDPQTLALKVAEMLSAGDLVLVKGARQMEMERVVDAIKVRSQQQTDITLMKPT